MKNYQMDTHFSQMNRNEVKIFECQLFNKENKPKIAPLYTSFHELKSKCRKTFQIQTKTQPQSNFRNCQTVYPIVWLDLINKTESPSNKRQIQHQNISKVKIFQELLKNSSSQNNNSITKRNSQILNEKNNKNILASSQDDLKNNQQKPSNSNDNLFVTAKPIKSVVFDDSNQQSQNMNILLIQANLFINDKYLQELSDDMISMLIYLSEHMIINLQCLSEKQTIVNKFCQCLHEKVKQIKKIKSAENKIKYNVDIIVSKQIKNQSIKNSKFIRFYEISSKNKESKISQNNHKLLTKIKKNMVQHLKLNNMMNKHSLNIQNFLKKCEISAQILTQTVKNKSIFSSEGLFSSEKIDLKQSQFEKQISLGQQKEIRQKLQTFFNDLRFKIKNQLPYPESIVDFKMDEFKKTQMKENTKSNKKLLQKITKQYAQKLHEYNKKQIKRLLKKSVQEYINLQIASNKRQNKDQLKYHPDKLGEFVQKYRKVVGESLAFVNEAVFAEIAVPKIYTQFYLRLYDDYKMKLWENQNYKRQGDGKALKIRQQLQQLRQKYTSLQESYQERRKIQIKLRQQLENMEGEKTRLSQDLITWKEKVKDAHRLLTKELSEGKRMQENIQMMEKRIQEFQSQKLQGLLMLGFSKQDDDINNKESGSRKSTQLDGLKVQQRDLLEMEKVISDNNRKSYEDCGQFEECLEKYRKQYVKLQVELREKESILAEKQSFYLQKIKLLQHRIRFSDKNSQYVNSQYNPSRATRVSQQLQQLQIQHASKLRQLQLQQQSKQTHFQSHIQQLESIIKSNHQNITNLNEIIAQLRANISSLQTSYEKQTAQLRQKNIQLSNKDKQIQTLKHQSQQKDNFIQQLTQQNLFLEQKLNEKSIKLTLLNENLHSLSTQKLHDLQTLQSKMVPNNSLSLNKSQNVRHQASKQTKVNKESFLRFKTDQDQLNFFNDSSRINDITTRSIYSNNSTPLQNFTSNIITSQNSINNRTPLKRSTSILKATTNQIKENLELQKLLEERKTIEKRKQKCIKREIILQEIQKNASINKSLLNQYNFTDVPFLSTQSKIYATNDQNMLSQKQFKALNNLTSNTKDQAQKQEQTNIIKKRLF